MLTSRFANNFIQPIIYQSRYVAALNGGTLNRINFPWSIWRVFTAPVLINITGTDNYAYSISENHKFFRLNPSINRASPSGSLLFHLIASHIRTDSRESFSLSNSIDGWTSQTHHPRTVAEAFPRTNTRERANKIFTSAHSTTRVHSSVRAVIWLWLAFLKAG